MLDDVRVYRRKLSLTEEASLRNFTHDFNLTQINTGFVFNAQNQNTISEVTGVDTWLEEKSIGFDVTQAVGTKQPTNNGFIGSLNALTFVEASSQSLGNTIDTDLWSSIGLAAFIVVVDYNNISKDQCILQVNDSLNGERIRVLINSTGTIRLAGRRLNTDSFKSKVFSSIAEAPTILTCVFDYNNDELWIRQNGLAESKQSFGQGEGITDSETTDIFRIGDQNGFNEFDGEMANLIYFNSLDDIEDAEGLFAWERGITLDASHKYATNPPKAV